MDINKIARKIADETNVDMVTAEIMAVQLGKVHPDLKEAVNAWLKGQEISFEFSGISLERIMRRNKCNYLHAIFSMSSVLYEPELAKAYLRPQVRQ